MKHVEYSHQILIQIFALTYIGKISWTKWTASYVMHMSTKELITYLKLMIKTSVDIAVIV